MSLFKKKGNENQLMKLLPAVKGEYLPNEFLANYTWFNVGGPAEVMYFPKDSKDLCHFMKNKPYNLPIFVIGGGSNLLVRDGGIPGVVIKLKNKFITLSASCMIMSIKFKTINNHTSTIYIIFKCIH